MPNTTNPQPDPQEQLERLASVLRPRQRLLTAFSGGIDSTLVAAVARQTLGRNHAPAAIGDSASLPRRELEQARLIAEELDLELLEVQPTEQEDPRYQSNSGDRCFHCKTHLYAALRQLAARRGIHWIANGTNRDDLGDYRPGLAAAEQAQIISPLVEAGFTKADVRLVAQHMQLPNWDKPAAACLSSRLPVGTAVTTERLAQIEQAESFLATLGFTGLRVRLHQDGMARLELPWDQVPALLDDDVRPLVIEGLKALGFLFIALDLEGYRSGSGNVLLTVSKGRNDA